MSWAAAEDAAKKFHPFLEQHVPHLVEEMRGMYNILEAKMYADELY